ncbi:GNAT family N-acetyltransferase [Actinomycetospora cinnamomea]|uniref:CelD/BcsL family acetyltransferase involved in cellulose biosynthesis n=1 Tax=Actinomycetospora cinnamomea TaxID=663609 RepID=A0A2U1FLG8_9PSEU|nr:GNAT family N-acetyltransferase [Actinomycetospora cinnamomea]PVZ13021.1 CelD/BcsL family acetyltransferase involved in cellulose biosynthesis [Actinomycetospora cinnamomea]
MAEVRALDEGLVAAWDRLALATGAPVFARPGWLRAWAGAFGKASALRALTVHRDGELAGVLPVVTAPLGVHTPVNSETALIAPVLADADAAGELAEHLLARRSVVDLDAVLADDPLTAALRDAAGRGRVPVLETHRCSSPYVATVGDPADFLQRLSRNRRHGLKRLRNRLRDAGEVTFEVCDGGDGVLEERLREGLALEAREWKLAAGSAILSSPARVAFYTAGARWAAEVGVLRLAFLRVDGTAIAFGYCLQQGRTLHFLKLGMDDAHAKLGPGVLLTQHLVEHAFAEPEVAELDLLGENESYKADFATGIREQVRLRAYPTPGVGTVQRAATARVADLRAAAVARLSGPTRERLVALRNRLVR